MNARTALTNATAGTWPALYISFLDILSDPMKIAGFVAILMQILLVAVKIHSELRLARGKKTRETDRE